MKDAVQHTVAADPYAWPWNGDLRPENTGCGFQ